MFVENYARTSSFEIIFFAVTIQSHSVFGKSKISNKLSEQTNYL